MSTSSQMSKVDEHKFLDEQAKQILLLRLHARVFSILRKINNVHDILEKVPVKKVDVDSKIEHKQNNLRGRIT